MAWTGSTKAPRAKSSAPCDMGAEAKFDELAQRLQTETIKLGQVARAKDEAGVSSNTPRSERYGRRLPRELHEKK